MWSVIGLGNPGAAYSGTRHNIGFHFIDLLAHHMGSPSFRNKGTKLHVAHATLTDLPSDNDIQLVKPQAFMNLSGQALTPLLPLKPEKVFVIHDDLDLPLGSLRLKRGGSAGGHKGVIDIISVLGPDFWRIRLGIGRPHLQSDTATYVLQRFKPHETLCVTRMLEALVKNFYIALQDPSHFSPILSLISHSCTSNA